jgi:hypothetical protein
MASARVTLPALSQLGGAGSAAATTTITYPTTYLDNGFGSANPSRLFVTATPLPAGTKPDKAGGVASPSFTVEAISSVFGPVADAARMTTGEFSPDQFLPSAKLLGALDLKEIIVAGLKWLDPAEVYPVALRDLTPDQLRAKLEEPAVAISVPVLARNVVLEGGKPVAVDTLYAWKPAIQDHKFGILAFEHLASEDLPDKRAELALTVASHAPIGDPNAEPTSRVDGRLDNFALDFANVIRVEFDRFAFSAVNGSKLDVNVTGVKVVFHGALEFVQTIQHILPATGFADPPYLSVLPTGVTAGYTLGVPQVGVGVVSLENLAIDASVSLPFTGDPSGVRFAISSREHPFIVTVSLFGGGGFFAIAVNTAGPPQIEAAIEFGGNFSLDIGVASGNVHVMAGIYFAMLGSQVKLSGYFRLGGSVEVLGLICISVEFYLALTYDDGKAYGEATLTVSVEVAMFSKSVSLHVERKIAGASGDPTFIELVDPPAWREYCEAFAA